MAVVVFIGFTNGEYRIVIVDFIVALRRTKGRRRRTLRSPSPPSSGLHLLTPGNPLWRGISAAAGLQGYSQLVSGAIDHLQFRILCSYLCSALYRLRFSKFRWACIFRFSLVVGWTVRSCGYVRFWHNLSLGSPLTATFFPNFVGCKPLSPIAPGARMLEKCVRAVETSRKRVFHTG